MKKSEQNDVNIFNSVKRHTQRLEKASELLEELWLTLGPFNNRNEANSDRFK